MGKRAFLFITLLATLQLVLAQNNELPKVNQKILEYTKSKLKKRIGRGECWDLAAQALKYADAQHPQLYVYGKKINHKEEPVLPGDIVQFYNVKTKFVDAKGTTHFSTMKKHTVIIVKVYEDGSYKVAEQNGPKGRKVALGKFNPNHMIKGRMLVYRPISKSKT